MDRNYYYKKMARQREEELSKKAATHRLFYGSHEKPIRAKWVRLLRVGFTPIIVFLTWLFLHFLH